MKLKAEMAIAGKWMTKQKW